MPASRVTRLPALAAAGDAGPAGHDEVAVARLQSRARPDVADDDARDGPVEARPAGEQPAAIEKAGAGEVPDPELALSIRTRS